jgi:hypothetical protein
MGILIVDYFATLSVARIYSIKIVRLQIKNKLERIWKEAAMAYSRYYPAFS